MATTLLNYRGTYTSLDKATTIVSATAKSGDFVTVNGTVYQWDTTTSTLVEYTGTDNYKGTFNNIYEVQQAYPKGSVKGDYVLICGFAHYWNEDRNTWIVTERRDEYIDELLSAMSTKIGEVTTLQNEVTAFVKNGYLFGGVIDLTSAAPSLGTYKIFFLSMTAGTYKNFGDKTIAANEVGIFKWDGTQWDLEIIALATKAQVTSIQTSVDDVKKAESTFEETMNKSLKDLTDSVNTQFSNLTNRLVATLTAQQEIIDFSKMDASYTLTWTLKREDGTAVTTPDTFSVTDNGTEIVVKADLSTGSKTVAYTITGTHAYTLKATLGGLSIEVSTTVYVVNPCKIGFAEASDAADVDVSALALNIATTNLTGTFSPVNDTDGKYLWIALPKDMTINNVQLEGFNIPMQLPSVKDNYNLYRSSNPLLADTYKIVIN